MKRFICPVCRYVFVGNGAPEECPVCAESGSKFREFRLGRLKQENSELATTREDVGFWDSETLLDDDNYRKCDPNMMKLLDRCHKHSKDIVKENVTPDMIHGKKNVRVIAYEDGVRRHNGDFEYRLYEDMETHDLYTMRIFLP